MKKIGIFATILLASQTTLAQDGPFFNIASSGGAPTPIEFNLCLNAQGPLSCQTYTSNYLNLSITTVAPHHTYPYAGIKITTPGYSPSGCTMISNGYCLFTASDTISATISLTQNFNLNAPWYPSLDAFEHYNSGRSHLFAEAYFGGSINDTNMVEILDSPIDYPSGYNMAYLDADHVYIYGGGYGGLAGSIGAYVAQVDPTTLESIWYNQLIDTATNGEWDYPGVLGILNDGYLYVVYGYRLAKIDPANGTVITTAILPTGGALPENTSFNGFNATSDGIIVTKAIYRQAGCAIQGPEALTDCPDPSDVPPSILISVNPKTMQVIDSVTLPTLVGARITVAEYNNQEYVYFPVNTTATRYAVQNGVFTLDSSWNPGTITTTGQTPCTSMAVLNDWIVAQSNSLPASTALSVIAINQGDATQQFSVQPFLGDSVPPYISAAFSTAGPGGTQAISWAPSSVSVDSDSNLIYASDSLPGKIAALTLSDSGLTQVWAANQRTTEFIALINPQASRVMVTTEIPVGEIPGDNTNDYVVWRNALTGASLAVSPLLPAMVPGTMVQPYYSGDMLYEGEYILIKLEPTECLLTGKMMNANGC